MERDLIKVLLIINAIRNGWIIKVKNKNEYQFIKPKDKVKDDFSLDEFINNLLGNGRIA